MYRWILVSTLLLAGCPKLGELGDMVNMDKIKPTVSFDKVKINEIDFQGANVNFVFDVANPNPIDVAVDSFTWDLQLADTPFLNGTEAGGLALEAQGSSKLRLPVSLVFTELIQTARAVKGTDEVPFVLSGTFGFNTKLGEVKVPYRSEGMLPVLRPPKIQFQGARVAGLDLLKQTAKLEVDLGVTHSQGKPMNFSAFNYNLALGNKAVADGVVADLGDVGADEEQTVTLPVDLNLLELGGALVQSIKRKEKLDMGLDAKVDVGTPFGKLPLKIDETGKVQLQ